MSLLYKLICKGLSQFYFLAKSTITYICVLFTLASASLMLALPSTVQAQTTVLVLGDSLSAGYGMAQNEAWPALLEQHFKNDPNYPNWRVINASISGETSEGGLRRLPTLLDEFQPNWLLLALGANDGLRGYPVASISRNLSNIIQQAQSFGAQVAVMGIQIPPNYGQRYYQPFFEQYAKLAAQFDTQLMPFILKDVALDPKLMQADGLHPTQSAQPIIRDNVLHYVDFKAPPVQ